MTCQSGFGGSQSGWITPGGGGGNVDEVTSPDGSVVIANGTGPIVEATATAASVGADPAGTAAAAVAAHVAAPDPHAQYVLEADQRVIQEEYPAFTLGIAPAYNTLRTWVIPVGESFSATGYIKISRGTGATVTTRTMRVTLNAKNPGTATSSGSPISTGSSSGDGPATQIEWKSGANPNEMILTIRDGLGSLADVGLTYTERRVSP